jgi:hypothetical protein
MRSRTAYQPEKRSSRKIEQEKIGVSLTILSTEVTHVVNSIWSRIAVNSYQEEPW